MQRGRHVERTLRREDKLQTTERTRCREGKIQRSKIQKGQNADRTRYREDKMQISEDAKRISCKPRGGRDAESATWREDELHTAKGQNTRPRCREDEMCFLILTLLQCH